MKEIYLKIIEINIESNKDKMDRSSVAAITNAIKGLREL